jgi:alanine racemase
MANSGALSQVLREDDISPDIFMDAVRLGIMLYGYPPSHEMGDVCARLGLRPAMRLMTTVSMVKNLPAGVGISYGHLYVTSRSSVIAVLPVGYADGYPRRLTHGGQVLVGGRLAPIAGAICMDQCMADVTGIPGVQAGDPVTMLGPERGITADCLADIVGTISYEVLCGIGKRVPREYV